MAASLYFVSYEGFGSVRPPEPAGRKLFKIYVRGYPGALNTLDGEAIRAIATMESVPPGRVRLRAHQLRGSVIEQLLRRDHPSFEAEVDASGAEMAWFSYGKPFDLSDF